MKRPYPPKSVLDVAAQEIFLPAPKLLLWIRETFLNPDSRFYHEEHKHLRQARIGALWTNAPNVTKGVRVVGMAEIPKPHPALGKWAKARQECQLYEWFGTTDLDYLLTFYAPYAATCPAIDFCAVVKHELCHCAQARDDFGAPKFRKSTGRPVFTIVDHDFAGFLSVARDFGAVERNTEELVKVLQRKPRISEAQIRQLCGTCLKRAA